MARLIKLYFFYFRLNLKRLTEFRADFLISLFAMIMWALGGLIEIYILLLNITEINGWDYGEMTLLYGMWSLTFAIYQAFGHGITEIEADIINGKLDIILCKPIQPLFQIMTSRISTMGIGMFLLGLFTVAISMSMVSISWTLGRVLYLMFSALTGGIMIFSMYLILMCVAFWSGKSRMLVRLGYDVHMFARYPVTIYGLGIKIVLMSIFPYAFTNYYPVAVILGKEPPIYAWISPIISLLIMGIALTVWKRGLRRYEGSGS